MDARRSPQRIVNAHPPDQRAQVRVDLGPASKGAGFPTPVPTEAGPMPTHQGLRSDDSDGPEHRLKPSIQQDQEQAIPICELDATPHPALQHNQLMTERRVLGLKSALRFEWRDGQVRKRKKSAIIAVDVRRFGHAINTDEVFGTHRGLFWTGCITIMSGFNFRKDRCRCGSAAVKTASPWSAREPCKDRVLIKTFQKF